jgi:LmbE family N-acetylglucosaminyl deacetylase
MRWIYISPHLDDAVLSAGGLIYEQARAGQDVEIWTLICGLPTELRGVELSPFAQFLHFRWGISDPADLFAARRLEDKAAADIVGAKIAHFDFWDAIYRRGKSGNWLYEAIFVPPHEEDADLPAQIAEAISARLKPDDQLVCQFGVGNHVDHVLVRRAVELLGRKNLLYLADFPYIIKHPEELAPHHAGMKETAHAVSEAGLRAWKDAVAAYTSQISSLFDSVEDMEQKVEVYCRESGGVRLWSVE